MAEKYSLPEKKQFTESLMNRGTVLLHLDPRKEGVIVPPWLGKQPQLVLQVGYQMPIPIPDLLIDESGVSATLSFNRSAYRCFVPWQAVFAVVGDDGRGTSWPDDLPAEIVAEIEREIRRAQAAKNPDAASGKSQTQSKIARPGERSESDPLTISRPKKRPLPAAAPARVAPAASEVDAEVTAPTPSAKPPQKPLLIPSRSGLKGKARPLPPYLRVIK